MPYTLICGGPSPFEPLDTWLAWLEELRAMDQGDDAVRIAIEEATRQICRLKSEDDFSAP